jgi:ribosomal protein S12 methylthiotransferase
VPGGVPKRVHVISMGCSKNAVDSERLMAHLRLNGIELTEHADDADVTVVNTCGFIDAAREESVDTIVQAVRHKLNGETRQVVAMGCLTQRYAKELREELPEVDGFFGSDDLRGVLRFMGIELQTDLLGERVLTTPSHYAYLKISEGCDNPCSFCSIPLMRGKHISRPIEDLVREAEMLASRGVRELIVIGQDTTYYGVDLDGKRQLARLLDRLSRVEGLKWLRLMYAYPARFPLDVLDVIADAPSFCRYLDMPVQHVSDTILQSMRRGISRRAMLALIERIQRRVPGIALRTTLIVGYPGETDREFGELVSFVRAARFARLGVFTYSREEGTSAHGLGDPVPPLEKERRQREIMEIQQTVSEERNEALVGTRLRVMIDRQEDEFAVGRTEFDAPEIDNEIFVSAPRPLIPGTFHEVLITDATEYDLYGRIE